VQCGVERGHDQIASITTAAHKLRAPVEVRASPIFPEARMSALATVIAVTVPKIVPVIVVVIATAHKPRAQVEVKALSTPLAARMSTLAVLKIVAMIATANRRGIVE
jgi:hypothetical protein